MREPAPFERLLSGLQSANAGPARAAAAPEAFLNPLARTTLPIGEMAADPGRSDLWDHAAAWAPDSEAEEAPSSAGSSDDVEAIASELHLANAATRVEILRARRRFMWKYHPDRRPDMSGESASQRVAIANMLVDRALATLLSRHSSAGSADSD